MKTKLREIEHRAVSGIWLLGEDFEDIPISEETYSWLWRNVYTICDNPRLIKMFWANSSQYFDFRLKSVIPDYNYSTTNEVVKNQQQVDKRKEEQNRFLEFHYALGGLLLYRKQYKTIKYVFEYSQSQPPTYPLLPQSMTEIFYWFEKFRNEFRHTSPIDLMYYFPELDNLGNSRQINYWICSYITVLFLRQYSLNQYYIYQDFINLPQLPDDVMELSNWLDTVSFFEKCLDKLLSNKELITDLEIEELVETKRGDFNLFIKNLKDAIKDKIGEQKISANLSQDKIDNFNSRTSQIIYQAFDLYKPVFIEKDIQHSESDLKLSVTGGITLMSKSAFTDNDIPHLNYDSFFASTIATHKIKYQIPNAFSIARTKRYLLNRQNVLLALSTIIGENSDVIIIGVHNGYQTQKVLDQSEFKNFIKYIPSSNPSSRDILFVLKKNNLPAIEHIDIEETEKKDLKLHLVNEPLKIYASIIDINKEENKEARYKWNTKENVDNEDLKVQLAISFLSVIYWKKNREVIQIEIASEYQEQGIQNNISDLKPL